MAQSLIDKINGINATPPRAVKSAFGGGFGDWLVNRANATDYDLRDRKYDLALAYLYIEAVRSPINLYEDAVRSIPIELVENLTGRPEDDKVIASTTDIGKPRHPVIDEFRKHQREYGTGYFAMQAVETLLYDEVAIELIRPTDEYQRQIAQSRKIANGLKVLRGSALTVQGLNGKIQCFYYNGDDTSVTLDPKDVAYAKGYNPLSDYHGSSSLLSVLQDLNIIRRLRQYALRLLLKAHRPDLYVSPNSEADRPMASDVELLQREFENYRRNPEQSAFFSSMALNYDTVPPPNINHGVELSEHEIKTIYRALGVSMSLVGDNSTTTYQQAPGVYANWVTTKVKPLITSILNLQNESVLPQLGLDDTYRLQADLSAFDVVTEDEKTRLDVHRNHLETGAITYGEYGELAGVTIPDELKDCIRIEGIPVPLSEASSIYQAKFIAPARLDVAQAQEATEQVEQIEDSTQADEFDTARKQAPANTTFDSVTYNGVTVQASPVQSSSRDDKKFMRYVRYEGDERLVHWGQPNEQMERDNPDARAAFNSRHSCDEKKDPFSAGFWACWAWQPNANVRSKSHSDDCGCDDTLPHKALFNDCEALYPSNDTLEDAQRIELKTWLKFARNRDGKPTMLEFDSDVLEPYLKYAVVDRLENANFTGDLPSLILDVFDDEAIKTVLMYRRKARSQFKRLWAGEVSFAEFVTNMNALIKQQFTQAFNQGVQKAGKTYESLDGEDQAELDIAISREQSHVLDLAADIFANRRATGGKLTPFRRRVELWIARYDKMLDLGYAIAMKDALLMWKLNPAKENCVDCKNLNDRVYTGSFWKSFVVPKSSELACFGTYCGCRLVKPPDNVQQTSGRKPSLRGRNA